MSDWDWKPYVPVAKRREQANRAVEKARKAGKDLFPVVVASRTIARTFWGKAWCANLEAYSDYESRLPRGRAYVRNGAVIDLKIEPGRVIAQVMGSHRYRVEIGIVPLPAARWKKLVEDCTGSIATLLELLQGKFSKAVMARLCEPKSGMFPSPQEISLGCSCPDWATMCKHVAAVLYGVGARLDEQPELLFVLRQVDANDLLTAQVAVIPTKVKQPAKAKVLDDAALADVFGIEMATLDVSVDVPVEQVSGRRRAATVTKATKATKATAVTTTTEPAKNAVAKTARAVVTKKKVVTSKVAAQRDK